MKNQPLLPTTALFGLVLFNTVYWGVDMLFPAVPQHGLLLPLYELLWLPALVTMLLLPFYTVLAKIRAGFFKLDFNIVWLILSWGIFLFRILGS